MKQIYLLIIALAVSIVSVAQTQGASTLYGYRQEVLPGMVRVDKSGREVPRQPNYNYFIYLASPRKVTPVELWINGEVHSVSSTNVSTTPVKYTHPTSGSNKAIVLVPRTNRKVLQLSAGGSKVQKPSVKGRALSEKNQLVIVYRSNGRLYYKTLRKFLELEHVAMQ